MTIEQEFFEAFGIEPKWDNIKCCGQLDGHKCNLYVFPSDKCRVNKCKFVYSYDVVYPPITPEIVLGLIELMGRTTMLEITTNNY